MRHDFYRRYPRPLRTCVLIQRLEKQSSNHNRAVYLCTDINPHACQCSRRTGKQNKVSYTRPAISSRCPYCHRQVDIHVVNGSLATPFKHRLARKIDIIVFNPPYVPTSEEEASGAQSSQGIGGAWAGGWDGMQITNILLNCVEVLISPQ